MHLYLTHRGNPEGFIFQLTISVGDAHASFDEKFVQVRDG